MPLDLVRPPSSAGLLVGQPMTVVNATLLPLVQCHCERGGSVVLMVRLEATSIMTLPGQCPSCGRVYVFRGLQVADGQITYAIELASSPPSDS